MIVTSCPHCGSDDIECVQRVKPTTKKITKPKGNDKNNLPKLLMIGGAVVAAPCIVASALGFGVAGIAAGSVAAGVQSTIGNVVAGSAFATMQSLGATGTFAYGATAGGATAAAGMAMAHQNNKNDEHGDEKEGHKEDDDPDNKQEKDTTQFGEHELVLKCKKCGTTFRRNA